MSQAGWQADSLTPDIWQAYFYTTYTTVRTAITTPIVVAFMFAVLRLAGPRTLTQATLMNKIVLVAVGSLVGGVALRPTTPLAATVIATAVIVGMALLVDAAYTRGWVPASLVHPRPLLVYADGQILTKNLKHAMLSPDKLHSELRLKGHCSMDEVFAAILEPAGGCTIITKDTAQKHDWSLLHDVVGYDEYLKPLVQGAKCDGHSVQVAGHPAGDTHAQHDKAITV